MLAQSLSQEVQRMAMGANKEKLLSLINPDFDSVEAHRQFVKHKLAIAFRIFGQLDYDQGEGAIISVRDPGMADHFWVNPLGKNCSVMTSQDLVLVDHKGNIRQGTGPFNTEAFAIHSRIHMANDNVHCVAHAHSVYGRAYSALGKTLLPISQDACVFYQHHGIYKDFSGAIETLDEGDIVARVIKNKRALIMQNHGLLTIGDSIDTAVALYIAMENACHAQILAQAAGEVTVLDQATALKTRQQNASPLALWSSFQSHYELVVARTPELRFPI